MSSSLAHIGSGEGAGRSKDLMEDNPFQWRLHVENGAAGGSTGSSEQSLVSSVASALQAGVSDPEREALFADFQPLVRRLIRQYGDTYELRQDLEGEIYCRF